MSRSGRLKAGLGGMVSTLVLNLSMVRRGLTFGVRAAVIDPEGRVLLVRHSYIPGWHMPGGGVEAGETVHDALVKELREEANVELTGPARLHGLFLNRHPPGRDHIAVFVVRDFVQSAPKRPDLEIREARFFPTDDLPEGVSRPTRARLTEVLSGAPPATEW